MSDFRVMKTALPTLSYHPTGFIWFEDFHSSAYTTERAFPRTDLEHLVRWDTFETEINDAIVDRMSAMNIPLGAEYDLGPLRNNNPRVTDEEGVRHVAITQLHDLVVDVLRILGIQGWFSSSSGKNEIIGEPDFSWLRDATRHPMVVIEYKTKWAASLEDLPACFRRRALKNANLNVRERQAIDAVFQLYGYMTFNDNKYGILSNMQDAWFFQRIETSDKKGKTLQYYGPIKFDVDSDPSPSMLKAFVGTVLLAETAFMWFHSSPTPAKATAIRSRDAAVAKANSYHPVVVNGSYQVFPLDPRLCHFDRSAVRHAPRRGSTLKAKLDRGVLAGGNLNVFCKIVDLFNRRDSIDGLDLEARNYATLQNLQGIVIPRVYGYYDVWGLLRLLALEDVGTAIPENGEIDAHTRALMRSALARIHSAGYVHGDIARRNFCKRGGVVFLVDLETLVTGNPEQMNYELAQINEL